MNLRNTSIVLAITYFCGQLIALLLTSTIKFKPIVGQGGNLFIGFIIALTLLVLLIKFKLINIWRAWYTLAVLLSITLTFSIILAPFYAFLIAILFTVTKMLHKTAISHNLTELFIYPGLAILFTPHFNVLSVSLLLVIIAVYDMFSVWRSKHMIMLAKAQEKADMYTGYYLPMNKGHIFLGGGDIAFPMLFTSVMFHAYGWTALIIPFFTTAAVYSLFKLKQKYFPAMLVLSLACLLTLPFFLV
jgi:presenilin-like A22 family membrane protease